MNRILYTVVAILLVFAAAHMRKKFNIETQGDTAEENPRSNPDIKKRRLISRKRMIVTAAAVILLFISIFGIDYFFGSRGSNYSFQIISFAGSGSIDSSQMEERLLEADISMVMPNGQITLNPDPVAQDGWAYGWGTANFYVSGEGYCSCHLFA